MNEYSKIKLASHLPTQGMSRAKDILPYLPFSRTTLHEWSQDGRFPSSVKLSPTMVAWRNSEVLAWLDKCESPTSCDNEAGGSHE